MNHLKLLLGFAALFLSSYPQSSIARDSPFTRHGTGPRYWIAYEECFVTNVPLSEERWKANIDWMEKTFKPDGYDMICNDGRHKPSMRTAISPSTTVTGKTVSATGLNTCKNGV